ncbi:MAG: NADH-ubiquinone oxidoreductase-F iron-sulfur binding region domain-containing protein [Acidimicrobiales bacterium]|jgi:NADH:ubiquinone oxidoreductase subunit F (NADH-binding)
MTRHLTASAAPLRSAAQSTTRRLTVIPLRGEPTTLTEHVRKWGQPPWKDAAFHGGQRVIDVVSRAGLLGRGGAAFPTAKKLAAVTVNRGRPLVIANGTEGEPASAKDKFLLATSPHLVIDGAVLAALAVGAEEVVIVSHPMVAVIVDKASRERRGINQDPVRIRVVAGAGLFVAGEASAVVQWLERGVPAPRPSPRRLAECGFRGRPTLVQNVETLAHLGLICRFGPEWFRSVGTPSEPGTMLVTVLGAVSREGVYEVEIGTPVSSVLALAEADSSELQALLLGGYFGAWSKLADVVDLPFSNQGLSPVGSGIGAGMVAALPKRACGLAETARVVRYLASESAGQCGPCVFGLPAVADELADLAAGAGDVGRLREWLRLVDGRGACHHPDGVARLVRSMLVCFAEEISLHGRRRCRAPGDAHVLPVPQASP